MKVPDVTTRVANLGFRNAVIVIVKVETEEGITEVAETVMKPKTRSNRGIDIGVEALPGGEGSMGSRIAGGEDVSGPVLGGGGPMNSTAISALDCALWRRIYIGMSPHNPTGRWPHV